MTDIRYVCISDLHLGEEDSILTAINNDGVDTNNPSPVMIELVRCLKKLVSKNEGDKKPTLILNGDILELALSTTNISTMVFERFLELFMKKGEKLFEKIIYIPGNHDHHMWEQIREKQYLGYIRRHPDHKLPAPWSKTPMFLEEEDHPPHWYFLEHVLKRYSSEEDALFSKNLKILVAYPNLGLRSINSGRCIVIHHGHFVEPVYRIMSTLKTIWKEEQKKKEDDSGFPENIQELEAENFAWIDFLWSALGRSGDVGNQTEAIYEHMHNSEYTQKYISKKAETVAKKIDVPIIPGDRLEKEGIELFLRWAFGEQIQG